MPGELKIKILIISGKIQALKYRNQTSISLSISDSSYERTFDNG